MADEQRYDDEQVAEILRIASEESSTDEQAAALQLPSQTGMSLAQLQEVAAEAGISPAAVARAAAGLARGDHQPPVRQTMAGLPVAVGRVIEFPRAVTDREWERMVLEFQDTFGARGQISGFGGVREWRNGNLRAVLEPVGDGHRLRLSTVKGDARQLQQLGIVFGGLGGVFALLSAFQLHDGGVMGASLGLLGIGGFALLRNAIVLPAWAKQRAAQMQALGGRLSRILDGKD